MAQHSAIILVKTWWKFVNSVRDIQCFFSFFPGGLFSTWKRETKLCDKPPIMWHTVDRTRVPWSKSAKYSRIGWIVFEKTNYMCFLLHLEKVEKEAKVLGKKINLYCPPHTGLRIRWNFSSVYSRLWDPLAHPFKKGGRGKLSILRKTEWLVFAIANKPWKKQILILYISRWSEGKQIDI